MTTLPGNPSMAQRIGRVLPTLTRSHRQVADYVLAHPLQAATMPIDELAATVGVSVATANRFARALEFDGYPQFRAALVLGFETTLAPVEKLRSKLEHPATVADVFASALAESQRNIELTRQSLDAQSCEQAVDAILRAQRIYIVGFGASSWLGGLLQRSLDLYCDNVQLLASTEGSSYGARVLTRLQPTDLLIAIAYPRYIADTVLLARRAREAGVPVLALTDRVTSPLAPLATVALYAHTDSQYFANSETTALAHIEALCSAVAHRAKGSLKAATQLAESVLPWLHGNHPGRLRPVADGAAPAPRKARAPSKSSKAPK
ncbi:MAG: MurR/RpiR family transcriptional regulator [Lysobacterales bacterium]